MDEAIQEKTGNIKDILKIVNRANETFAYEIFIPSLNRNVMFREINTSQQKRLLKAIIDSPAYNTEFIFALRQIILENCVEPINLDNLNIFDKMIIAMTMRSMSISNDLDLQFQVPNSEEKITRRINLKDLVDSAIKEIKVGPMTITDDSGIYEIFCDLPTINDEYRLENELRKNVTSIEIKNEQQLRETVGNVFTNELVKYIKQINIKNGEETNEINLRTVKFADRLEILNQIPTKITQKVIEYINTISKEFEKVILFKETINGQVIEQRLKIDASFFIRS